MRSPVRCRWCPLTWRAAKEVRDERGGIASATVLHLVRPVVRDPALANIARLVSVWASTPRRCRACGVPCSHLDWSRSHLGIAAQTSQSVGHNPHSQRSLRRWVRDGRVSQLLHPAVDHVQRDDLAGLGRIRRVYDRRHARDDPVDPNPREPDPLYLFRRRVVTVRITQSRGPGQSFDISTLLITANVPLPRDDIRVVSIADGYMEKQTT